MKYRFSVNVYDEEQFPHGVKVQKEFDADTFEDACGLGRSIMFHDIPELAKRGILPGDALIESRFSLEEVAEP